MCHQEVAFVVYSGSPSLLGSYQLYRTNDSISYACLSTLCLSAPRQTERSEGKSDQQPQLKPNKKIEADKLILSAPIIS